MLANLVTGTESEDSMGQSVLDLGKLGEGSSGHGGRSRDGSVDGDGSADTGSNHGSNPDDSTAEAAAGLRLFGIERASRPFNMQPTGSHSIDI